MNLETFKARARRKLALPARNADSPAAPEPAATNPSGSTPGSTSEPTSEASSNSAKQYQANSMNTPKTPASTSASATSGSVGNSVAGADRFAAALDFANQSSAEQSPTADPRDTTFASDPRSDNFAPREPKAANPQPRSGAISTRNMSSDAQLAHLRSLLLGDEQDTQQDQAEAVYRRTQSDLNSLRRDMDGRLTDLSKYVEQLEQSLLNNLDNQKHNLSDDKAEMLSRHEQRLDALDTRLDAVLDKALESARADRDEQRKQDREDLDTRLTQLSRRHDTMLNEVSDRLDRGLAQMESSISEQLKSHSTVAPDSPEQSMVGIREQLAGLIDERVNILNGEQDKSLTDLRNTVLMHTSSIKEELQAQTEQQSNQLATHREEMETQFNRAILSLNDNKVSHRQLSELLTRLADRVKQL